MDDPSAYNPIIGSYTSTKYIPYELFLDTKEQFDIEALLNNRISICLENSGFYNIFDLEKIIINHYITPICPVSGRWTFKFIEKDNTYRVELMFENETDYSRVISDVLVLDKLTRE